MTTNGKELNPAVVQNMMDQAAQQEVLLRVQATQMENVGGAVVDILQRFAPDVNMGTNVMLNIVASTAARFKIPIEQLHDALDKIYQLKQAEITTAAKPTDLAVAPELEPAPAAEPTDSVA